MDLPVLCFIVSVNVKISRKLYFRLLFLGNLTFKPSQSRAQWIHFISGNFSFKSLLMVLRSGKQYYTQKILFFWDQTMEIKKLFAIKFQDMTALTTNVISQSISV
jgi:hypothetical protein